jgi:hypothetical protein
MTGGIALLGLSAIAALAVLAGQSSFEPTQPPDPAITAHSAAPSRGPKVSIVRVDAGGDAVIAGTAPPGALVTIDTGGAAIGTTTADRNGAFAFVTGKPLPAGSQQITLSAQKPDGSREASAAGVMVNVPVAPNEGALAVLSGKTLSAFRLLDHDHHVKALAIGSIDYAGSGSATISGTATPDSRVQLFMGSASLGKAMTSDDGHWEMHTNALPKQPGTFRLKALGAHGSVVGQG